MGGCFLVGWFGGLVVGVSVIWCLLLVFVGLCGFLVDDALLWCSAFGFRWLLTVVGGFGVMFCVSCAGLVAL